MPLIPTSITVPIIRGVIDLAIWATRTKATAPDSIKTYDVRPMLPTNRIFRPHGVTLQSGDLLPLILNVHGGGWLIGNPAADDEICRYLADHAGATVISLDYRKAPGHRFPTALEDVIALASAAIEDPELNVDKTQIVLVGSSAGGNLVLAAAQSPQLKGKVKALIGVYPACDAKTSLEVKMQRRVDNGKMDGVGKNYHMMLNEYAPPGTVELDDVRLSPFYFKERSDLPEYVYSIGCEFDVLCDEASRLMDKLNGDKKKVDIQGGWKSEDDMIVWEIIPGVVHGFDHHHFMNKEKTMANQKIKDELFGRFSDWLVKVVFTKSVS